MKIMLLIAIAAARASASAAGSIDLCAPMSADIPDPQVVTVHGTSIRIPQGFATMSSSSYEKVFIRDRAIVGIIIGHTTPLQGSYRTVSTCHVVIGNRRVKITQYLFGAGASEAVAEWPAENKIPLVQVWIDSRYPSDLMDLRQIFWTAQFPGFTPVGLAQQDCREAATAVKNADALLDTGLVSMLVAGAAPPLPRGNAVFEFTFDTSGVVGQLDIPASTLPDSALKRLAAIVGSNVRQQPRVAGRAGLRLELDSAGVSYSLLPVSACGRP